VRRRHAIGEARAVDHHADIHAELLRARELVLAARGADDMRAERAAELDRGSADAAADRVTKSVCAPRSSPCKTIAS